MTDFIARHFARILFVHVFSYQFGASTSLNAERIEINHTMRARPFHIFLFFIIWEAIRCLLLVLFSHQFNDVGVLIEWMFLYRFSLCVVQKKLFRNKDRYFVIHSQITVFSTWIMYFVYIVCAHKSLISFQTSWNWISSPNKWRQSGKLIVEHRNMQKEHKPTDRM